MQMTQMNLKIFFVAPWALRSRGIRYIFCADFRVVQRNQRRK
jgi:hypothetical protein